MIRDVLPNGMSRVDESETSDESLQGFQMRDPIDAADATDAATAARAAANIADWCGYLPEDCVRAMIRDGWHLST